MNDKIIQYCREKDINILAADDFYASILETEEFWTWIYEQEKLEMIDAIIGIGTKIKALIAGIVQKVRIKA